MSTNLEINEIQVNIFLDFDGVLTGASGSATVESEFYKNLLTDPSEKYSSARATFKENLESELRKIPIDDPLSMKADAVEFLKQRINKKNFRFVIVSKNREEYIRAMLRVNGFREDEISNITIIDIKTINRLKNKKRAILAFEEDEDRKIESENMIAACYDDSWSDADYMEKALKQSENYKKVIGKWAKTGCFDFREISQNIEAAQQELEKSMKSKSSRPNPSDILETDAAKPLSPHAKQATAGQFDYLSKNVDVDANAVNTEKQNKSTAKENLATPANAHPKGVRSDSMQNVLRKSQSVKDLNKHRSMELSQDNAKSSFGVENQAEQQREKSEFQKKIPKKSAGELLTSFRPKSSKTSKSSTSTKTTKQIKLSSSQHKDSPYKASFQIKDMTSHSSSRPVSAKNVKTHILHKGLPKKKLENKDDADLTNQTELSTPQPRPPANPTDATKKKKK